MHIDLRYGKGTYRLDLDPAWDVTVIRKPEMPLLADPVGAVRAALAQPVGARPLAEEARGARSACILVCDITRPVPNGLFLPLLVRTLMDAGVPKEGITILVATGLHRPNQGAELEEMVGPDIVKNYRIENHFGKRLSDHEFLGITPNGVPAYIDKRYVHADLKITTGQIGRASCRERV